MSKAVDESDAFLEIEDESWSWQPRGAERALMLSRAHRRHSSYGRDCHFR